MIGVISDTHDNVINVLKAIKIFENAGVDFIIHCGDIISPATMKFFNGIHTKVVRGNCDGDIEHIKEVLDEIKGEYLGEVGEVEIFGKRILAYHGSDEGRLQNFIEKQGYDYILTGHTHKSRNERIGKTRVINPGAHYYGCENKVAFLDIEKDKVEFVELK